MRIAVERHRDPAGPAVLPIERVDLRKQFGDATTQFRHGRRAATVKGGSVAACLQTAIGMEPDPGVEGARVREWLVARQDAAPDILAEWPAHELIRPHRDDG